jgi:glutamine synthetase
VVGNAYEQTEIRTPYWRQAIGDFMASDFIRDQFGESFRHVYGQQKLKEMLTFETQVSTLEYDWYLRAV